MSVILCTDGVLVIASHVESVKDIRHYGWPTKLTELVTTSGSAYTTALPPDQVLDLIFPTPAEPEPDPNQPALELDFSNVPDEVVLPAIPPPARKRAAK